MRSGCFRLCFCCCCVSRYRPYSRWLILGGILVVLVVLLLWEENNYWGGNIAKWYGNRYSQLLYFPISTRRTAILEVGENSTDVTRQINIGIVVVMNLSKDGEEYRLAQKTLRCYCLFHEYSYLLIDLEAGSINNRTDANVAQWKKRCTQTDFMFRRHCVLAQLLRHHQTFDYVLFMDADIGVINPNHLVEEYIQVPKADLVFYGRLFNHEVMAGSYIARRSDYTIEFLEKWADYFFKLPHSFHGSDNGAIHAVLLDQLCVDCAPTRKRICHELWATSVDYKDLSLFTSCVRSILGHRNLLMDENTDGLIVILSNFTGYWARDGWLTGNFWSADDFMLHGWQMRRQDRVIFAGWHSPLGEHSTAGNNSNMCGREVHARAYLQWPYKDSFIKKKEYIRKRLIKAAASSYAQHLDNLRQIDYKFMDEAMVNG